jgi:hypothetical protein
MHAPISSERYQQALLSAEALRREAIDDFWRGSSAVLATAATRSLRAARRLAARLAHHRQARAQPEA